MLAWFGDIGGLLEALKIIGAVFVGPISAFALDSTMMANIFRSRKSRSDENSSTDYSQQLLNLRTSRKGNFSKEKEIDEMEKTIEYDFNSTKKINNSSISESSKR